MINPQCLELPISRTNFHGPKRSHNVERHFSFHLKTVVFPMAGRLSGRISERELILSGEGKSVKLSWPHKLSNYFMSFLKRGIL